MNLSRRGFIRLAAGGIAGGAHILTAPAAQAERVIRPRRISATESVSVPRLLSGVLLSPPARVIAVGITGSGAVGPVGRFLPGGPIHDNATFAVYTQPGKVLDPERVLVGSSSNYGAPLAVEDQAPGSMLSIDPNGAEPLIVPAAFAVGDGQVSTLNGGVQLFSAQSPAFLNGINSPAAATAGLTGVSAPRGLSINNAFGRIWPSNMPGGFSGPGSESILDPNGLPLAGPPSPRIGGVYSADLTDRHPRQLYPGSLSTAALGTSLLGRSPDGSTRAVFAAALADGSLIQMHTEQGLDGLAPPGTITPLIGAADGSLRYGVALNFEPVRVLYVTDPLANTVVAMTLTDDKEIFYTGEIAHLVSPLFNQPVGLAPVQQETEDTDWASNTMLFEHSDLYIGNRGDGTLVRMRQDGSVVAAMQVTLPGGSPLGARQLTGVGVSSDGGRIWVTFDGEIPGLPGLTGGLLELPAFGG